AGLRLDDQRPLRPIETERLGNLRGDGLNLHADAPAHNRAVRLELRHDRTHGLGWNRKTDADRAAGRRADRAYHAVHVTVHVERRPAGIALVHRGGDLDEVGEGAKVDVARPRRDDARGDGATEPEWVADRQHPFADARHTVGQLDKGYLVHALD